MQASRRVTVNRLRTEVLVVGGGAAGLRAAIEARRFKREVLLISKTPAGFGSCSTHAGGGFFASFGRMTPEEHFEQTVRGGKFLNNQRLVEVMTHEANARLLELAEFGVDLKTGDGTARVECSFAMNGGGLTLPLVEFARSSGIQIIQNLVATRLCKSGDTVVGLVGFNRTNGEITAIQSKSTVLASGGAGQIYSRTDTPVAARALNNLCTSRPSFTTSWEALK